MILVACDGPGCAVTRSGVVFPFQLSMTQASVTTVRHFCTTRCLRGWLDARVPEPEAPPHAA